MNYQHDRQFAALDLDYAAQLDAQECVHCGPVCRKGAAHNARKEEGVLFASKNHGDVLTGTELHKAVVRKRFQNAQEIHTEEETVWYIYRTSVLGSELAWKDVECGPLGKAATEAEAWHAAAVWVLAEAGYSFSQNKYCYPTWQWEVTDSSQWNGKRMSDRTFLGTTSVQESAMRDYVGAATQPAERARKRNVCTCHSHQFVQCRGQNNLGDGWVCAETLVAERAPESAEPPKPSQKAASEQSNATQETAVSAEDDPFLHVMCAHQWHECESELKEICAACLEERPALNVRKADETKEKSIADRDTIGDLLKKRLRELKQTIEALAHENERANAAERERDDLKAALRELRDAGAQVVAWNDGADGYDSFYPKKALDALRPALAKADAALEGK